MSDEQLGRKRGAIRRQVNQLLEKVKDSLNIAQRDDLLLEALRIQLEDKNKKLEEINSKIEESITESDELDKEFDSQNEYSEKVVKAIVQLRSVLTPNKDELQQNPLQTLDASLVTSAISDNSTTHLTVKLPKLKIEKYNGEISKWQSFWSQYEATVHKNPNINKAEKFSYLQSFLSGQALNSVTGLALTSANYDAAIKILNDRFGRKDLIINLHMNDLLNLKQIKRSSDIIGLRKLYDACETRIRGLETLGVNINCYGSLLCPVLMRALPEEFTIDYSRRQADEEACVETLMEFLRKEITSRERTHLMIRAETNDKLNDHQNRNKDHWRFDKKERISSASALNILNERSCIFCENKAHQSYECTEKKTNEKFEILKRTGRCFNCFGIKHTSTQCRSKRKCKRCGKRHHSSLCLIKDDKEICKDEYEIKQESQESFKEISTNTIYDKKNEHVLLQTILIGINGKSLRCLLDGGSQRSFILKSVVDELKLPIIGEELLSIISFGVEKQNEDSHQKVKFKIDSKNYVSIEALVVPLITNTKIPSIDQKLYNKYIKGLKNATKLQKDCGEKEISVLIGADYYWKIVTGKIKRLNKNLVAIETIFGWCIQGRVAVNNSKFDTFTGINCFHISISEQLKAFWEIENLGIVERDDNINLEDQEALNRFNETIEFKNGRYQVSLIWKSITPVLADNYNIALKRLNYLLRKLNRDKILYDRYKTVIDEQLKQGIIEKVNKNQHCNTPVYYIPHQPVINEHRESTKLRIVYDASSHCEGEKSLNECLHQGPNLNPLLINVLLNFRKHKIAFTADIKQAFLQISIRECDRDAVRFLWCDSFDSTVNAYRLTRVLFGSRSSPFLLSATIRHHLKKYEEKFPKTIDLINQNLYVDDLVVGADTLHDANRITKECVKIFSEAHMELAKFYTHSNELIDAWIENGMEIKQQSGGLNHKVLGVCWNVETDQLYFDFSDLKRFLKEVKNTKRYILQTSARIYDPFGLVAPYVITIKIMFQQLWLTGVDWDDELTFSILDQWKSWYKQILNSTEIKIPRYFAILGEIKSKEIHGFCDASEKAYGAVIYIKTESYAGSDVKFIISKSRVAPVKRLTLPRLELMGALILCRLMKNVIKCFGSEIKTHAWTDSTIVLYWIKGSTRESKAFVSNRVGEIISVIEPENWYHCQSKDNPADIVSRGVTLENLSKSTLWWHGPHWLMKPKTKWPEQVTLTIKPEKDSKKNVTEVITNLIVEKNLIDVNRFSSLRKLLRVTSFVIRFAKNCQGKKISGGINTQEINQAEINWIKWIQNNSYSEEIKKLNTGETIKNDSTLMQFSPFLKNGLICHGGRLQNSDLPQLSKHPVILPRDHKFIILLIQDIHHKLMHAGVNETLIQLRERYFVPRARSLIRKVINNCFKCKLFNSRKGSAPFAPLPKDRVTPAPAFSVTGLDYAGPIFVKDTNSKAYICLFTCAVSRAVHLELVHDMSADTFILALKRFVGRRGVPHTIYSDNGKTFKKSEKILFELFSPKNLKVQGFIENQRITWKYIVERAPWWGGFWERLVRSIKTPLRKILGRALLKFEEIETILVQIEAILNSRPISYVEPNELFKPITPADLLVGKRLLELPSFNKCSDYENINKYELTRRIKYRDKLVENFWNRWKKEYLLELRTSKFNCLKVKNNNFKVNDIVLVADDKFKRQQWKLGLIKTVQIGRDQKIRSCIVRLANGTELRRPVQLLYQMEINSANDT